MDSQEGEPVASYADETRPSLDPGGFAGTGRSTEWPHSNETPQAC